MSVIRNDRARARRRIPGVKPPRGVELAYAKALRTYLGHARALVKTMLLPQLDDFFPAAKEHRDAVEAHYRGLFGYGELAEVATEAHLRADAPTTHHGMRISGVMGTIRLLFEARTRGEPEQMAKTFGALVAKNNERRSARLLKSVPTVNAVTPDIAPMVNNFVIANVERIESIPAQAFAQVQQMVRDAALTGMRHEELADDIEDRFDVAESRAKLIARDQVGKLNSAISQVQQESVGVTSYIWRGAMDERERPEHRMREGQVFDWDDPPEDGHPGFPIQCRCVAEAILPTDEENKSEADEP